MKIDFLWDKPPQDGASKKLRLCKELLKKHKLNRSVHIHSDQTDSHAKILVADDGDNSYYAVIGSCNWLNSGFGSVEVSVKLRSPQIVADCFAIIERLAFPLGTVSGTLHDDLVKMGCELKRNGSLETGTARAQIVQSVGHDYYMRKARDEACTNIFVASHRLGGTAETQVLIPADSVVRKDAVDRSVYYERVSGPAQGPAIIEALNEKYKGSINIKNVNGAHAKFLCWDDDHILVTSLNWLSKDTDESNPLGEVGVYIQAPGLAVYLEEQYLSKVRRKGNIDD